MAHTVRFEVPVEAAFDYLVDPHNRPDWQSSLSRVDEVDGEPRVGQTWIDVTKPGVRPAMETTELDRPHRWTEVGTWHGISAELTLTFEPVGALACDVSATMKVRGRGLLAPVGWAANLAAPLAVRADLASAGRHAASAAG